MFKFLIALIIIGFVLWRFRVPLLAKILGQPQSRIERQLNRRKER